LDSSYKCNVTNFKNTIAGDNLKIAKYYPEDDNFLLEKEKHVPMYQLKSWFQKTKSRKEDAKKKN